MGSQDWMTHDHQPRREEPHYPETLLWTLTKGEKTLTATIRQLPHDRRELRIMCGSFFEGFTFHAGDPRLGVLADEKKRDFEGRGWR